MQSCLSCDDRGKGGGKALKVSAYKSVEG